jgi:hypothetical protein
MICQYCNQEGFKDKKGLASHRKLKRECYEKWKAEVDAITYWGSKRK